MRKSIPFLIFLFLFSSLVVALGTNGRVIVQYEPGETYEGKACAIPEGRFHVELSANGALSEYIDIEKTRLNLENGSKCVPYTLNMPEGLEKPGMHKSTIRISEVQERAARSQIVALVSVGHQVWVEVPYPGKYLETSLKAENVEAGEIVPFSTDIVSKGNLTIESVSGNIEIYDSEGNKIDEVSTTTANQLEKNEEDTLYASWNSSGFEVGNYRATAVIQYDGNTTNASTGFKLGSLEVRLAGATNQVYKSGIVPYIVKAESYWSESISGVTAHIQVLNDSVVLGEFDTLTSTLQPWNTESLKGYLDTSGIPYGNYTANITLSFAEQSRNYQRVLEVAKEPVKNEEQPGVLSKVGGFLSSTQGLLAATIVLALIALALAIKVFRQSGRKD